MGKIVFAQFPYSHFQLTLILHQTINSVKVKVDILCLLSWNSTVYDLFQLHIFLQL